MNQPQPITIQPAGSVGGRIRQARQAVGLSQAQLAERIDASLRSVGQWEGDRVSIHVDRLIDVAIVLGRPVEWFVMGLDADRPSGDAVIARYRPSAQPLAA